MESKSFLTIAPQLPRPPLPVPVPEAAAAAARLAPHHRFTCARASTSATSRASGLPPAVSRAPTRRAAHAAASYAYPPGRA